MYGKIRSNVDSRRAPNEVLKFIIVELVKDNTSLRQDFDKALLFLKEANAELCAECDRWFAKDEYIPCYCDECKKICCYNCMETFYCWRCEKSYCNHCNAGVKNDLLMVCRECDKYGYM